MAQVEKNCPSCNARMYQRKVKKGTNKGKMGWGCPYCFMLLPEHTPKLDGMVGIIKSMFPNMEIEIEIKEEEPFDFWKKPENKPREDDADAE